MKKSLAFAFVAVIASAASTALAGGPSLYGNSSYFRQAPPPAPAGAPPMAAPPAATPDAVMGIPVAPMALFSCVKYRDLNNVHPCAVTKVVQVADPCKRCCDPCACCQPRCVNVQICVPPQHCCSCPPKVSCSRDGKKLRLDYGKYAVDVRVKNGYVEVDYDD